MIFSSRRFLQKTNERILLYYYETSDWLVFVRVLEETSTWKNYFEIIWPLVTVKSTVEILQNFVAFSEYMNFIKKSQSYK